MSESAPSPTNDDGFFKGAPEAVKADWEWLSSLYTVACSQSYVSDAVRSTTRSVRQAFGSAHNLQESFQTAINGLNPIPSFVEQHKEILLEIRRQYKASIVTCITAVSLAGAIRAGPGRLEKLRIAARNMTVFGGGAAIVLYPELIMRVAPYASAGVDKVRQMTK